MTIVTQIRHLFPEASAELLRFPEIWDIEVDPQTLDGVRALYRLIVLLENTSQEDGPDALVRTARALRTDLLCLLEKEPASIDRHDLHALLMATTLGPAGFAVQRGRSNLAYDWLLWSLTTTWDIDGEHVLHF